MPGWYLLKGILMEGIYIPWGLEFVSFRFRRNDLAIWSMQSVTWYSHQDIRYFKSHDHFSHHKTKGLQILQTMSGRSLCLQFVYVPTTVSLLSFDNSTLDLGKAKAVESSNSETFCGQMGWDSFDSLPFWAESPWRSQAKPSQNSFLSGG